MSGAAIKVTIDDREAKELLGRIQKNLGDLTPPMKIIGSIARTSIIRNFEKSGRPKKWKKHSKVTEKRRGKGAKILMKEGMGAGLAGSIHSKADKESATVGTNKIYAAVHQFGAKKGSFGTVIADVRKHLRKGVKVKAHKRKMKLPWGDIPARPYLMIQNEDWPEMTAALGDYILGGT